MNEERLKKIANYLGDQGFYKEASDLIKVAESYTNTVTHKITDPAKVASAVRSLLSSSALQTGGITNPEVSGGPGFGVYNFTAIKGENKITGTITVTPPQQGSQVIFSANFPGSLGVFGRGTLNAALPTVIKSNFA